MYFYILIALAICLVVAVIYCIIKVIRYFAKMLGIRKKLRKAEKYGCKVEFCRSLFGTVFGDMGDTDFIVKKGDKSFDVSVISFVSTNGRWNFEKTANGDYYIEARRYPRIVYGLYKNSGTEPEHSKDYRRETRYKRCKLNLSQDKEAKILLICPRPKLLTTTTTRLDYVNEGDKICGCTVMYEKSFFDALKSN